MFLENLLEQFCLSIERVIGFLALIVNNVRMLQPVAKFDSFTVDDRPGEQWIRLEKKFGDEDIKVEVTMFDGAIPASKSGGSGSSIGNEVQLHVSLIVNITKGGDVFEIMCSAWPDSIEINRLFIRHGNKIPAQPYTGPGFKYDFPPLLIIYLFSKEL